MGGNTTAVLMAALCLSFAACTVSDKEPGTDEGRDYAGEYSGTDDGSGSGSGSGEGEGEGEGDGDGSGSGVDMGSTGNTGGAMGGDPSAGSMLATGCATAYGSGIYTPFPSYGPVSVGTPGTHP